MISFIDYFFSFCSFRTFDNKIFAAYIFDTACCRSACVHMDIFSLQTQSLITFIKITVYHS